MNTLTQCKQGEQLTYINIGTSVNPHLNKITDSNTPRVETSSCRPNKMNPIAQMDLKQDLDMNDDRIRIL
jgi:hypothetical protein